MTIDGVDSFPLYDPCQALGQFFQNVRVQSSDPIIPSTLWAALWSFTMFLRSVAVGSLKNSFM
jgi:hypothetical protein